MPIRQMINTRDPEGTPREFQQRLTTVGKIRLGVFATPEGKRGRPEKIDTFRFTSETESLIRGAAELYGGTVEQWTPQGSRTPQWQVVSDAKALPVYIVHGQDIDPNYEAWGGGRTCLRRCDGVWNRIGGDDGQGTPCVCNGPQRPAAKDMCKITLRVQLMLQELPGIGSWLLETHGENATSEISSFSALVKHAPMPVPAIMRLREETRREWNPNRQPKPGFETRSFYVPWFDVSVLTARQVAIGGDAVTQALRAAGAPVLGAAEARPALEAAPEAANGSAAEVAMGPVRQFEASAAQSGRFEVVDRNVAGDVEVVDADPGLAAVAAKMGANVHDMRTAILGQIEKAYTLDELVKIREKLQRNNVRDKQIKDAWNGRKGAIEAATEVGGSAPGPVSTPANADHQQALRDVQQAKVDAQAATAQILDDRNDGAPPPDWAVGDTVTVGGTEFTKVADESQAFGPGGTDIPAPSSIPDNLDVDTEWAALFAAVPKAWSTQDLHDRIKAYCKIEKSSKATAHQLYAVRQAIASGNLK